MPPFTHVYSVEEFQELPIRVQDLGERGFSDVNPQIFERGYLGVRFSRGLPVLTASHFVGLIPINARLAVIVSPRVPVRNLARILSSSEEGAKTLSGLERSYRGGGLKFANLLEILAEGLVALTARIQVRGLQMEYLHQRQASAFLRGKLLIGETTSRFRSSRPRASPQSGPGSPSER